jgi:hypothetical protein
MISTTPISDSTKRVTRNKSFFKKIDRPVNVPQSRGIDNDPEEEGDEILQKRNLRMKTPITPPSVENESVENPMPSVKNVPPKTYVTRSGRTVILRDFVTT